MSSLIADIVEFDVERHPNADKLSIAKIRGKAWQCVFNHEQWGLKAGDVGKGLYIPIEALIPENLIVEHNLANYVHKGRIRSIKLRGCLSQGLLLPIGKNIPDKPVGTNLAEELNIQKYDPPIPVHLSGELEKKPEGWQPYTDIENYKNFPGMLKDGELVWVTEKLHGACLGCYKWEDRLWISSRNLVLKRNEANSYWKAILPYEEMLLNNMENGDHLFGELLGVQDLKYGYENGNVGVRFFDYMKIDGTYLCYEEFTNWILNSFGKDDKGLPVGAKLIVPVILRGNFDIEKINKLVSGNSVLAKHIKEGIVIRPDKERFDSKVGRVVLKFVNDEYLLKDNRTEYH